jgi:hypothetical protein
VATKPYLTESLGEWDTTRRARTAETATPDDLSAFAEFDPDAAEKLYRNTLPGGTAAGAAADLPLLMSDAEVDGAAASRRNERHSPFMRKERPDPWPVIAERFPRIAATIREQWGKRSLDDYFAKLVVDDRGGRQGFPPDVLAAILEIARLHGTHFGFAKPLCPWEADVSQTKWWSER